jgi:branched-chain amino acid transport system permease protein
MADVLLFGLSNSMQLALIAIGFSFVFGISGIANFSYGAFYLFGGYLAFALFKDGTGIPYLAAAGLAVLLLFIVGALTYRIAIQRIRGAMLSEVIVTMGLGVFIIELMRAFSNIGHNKYLPAFFPGYINIFGVGIENQRLMIIFIGLMLFIVLWAVTRFTRIGLAFRAMSQDELTALSLGLNNNFLAMLAMGIGAALAVVAALCIIPQGFLSIDGAYEVLIYALAVGVLGGMSSTSGIIVGAFILGYAQTFTARFFSPQWTMVVTFLAIVLVLLIKPSGIFGKQKELEERV